eukprot:CAMPEP_0176459972 /NCGR_PEP_ID=MMETSP0127-20121128/33653_1 /TAXON_ID=938130 /ORGANISM="Platyophrya macrostoma, Strain WH" /LENGTH=133 /DNA_ID=CAMNT_0017851127 /DNA_START=22 /DNA_END=420 /DNA_ORIENTATION=+
MPHISGPRLIESGDFDRGYFELLSLLTVAPKPQCKDDFEARLALMNAHGVDTLVLVDDSSNQIVGSVSVLVEPKFIRNLSFVAHIEDVVVHPHHQGKHLGMRLIEGACLIAKSKGCYKAILDADEKNGGFYER